ncbi:MAG: hypothetical protein QHC79_09720 [Pseudosphingobacterium sp.]|nr:hypothetical protein [Pseudosphingobacterium sp.]
MKITKLNVFGSLGAIGLLYLATKLFEIVSFRSDKNVAFFVLIGWVLIIMFTTLVIMIMTEQKGADDD